MSLGLRLVVRVDWVIARHGTARHERRAVYYHARHPRHRRDVPRRGEAVDGTSLMCPCVWPECICV